MREENHSHKHTCTHVQCIVHIHYTHTHTPCVVLEELLSKLATYLSEVQKLRQWLDDREAQMITCGSIGADLPRLLAQGKILESLDDDVLEHKRLPEEVMSEAMNLLKACREGSGGEVAELARELQARFDNLSERSLESKELCEEATSELQGEIGSVEDY